MSTGFFKNRYLDIYLIYMYKEDLGLNNLQELTWHKPN